MTPPRRTTRLRRLLQEPPLTFLMEAHHALSARIAEEAGFPALWASRLPVILIPTACDATPTAPFREYGVSAVIWANHLLRASIVAMREVAERVMRDEHVGAVEKAVAPLAEVFPSAGRR